MFPMQQHSIIPDLLKPALIGWASFSCRPEGIPLAVGARRGVWAVRPMEWMGEGD